MIHVFIVEDDAEAKEMFKKHFCKGGAMTYAAMIDKDFRPELVDAIDRIQDL